jgi:hypothetical protein
VRGKAIDLLIVDEACFVAEEIWRAAQFTVLARPDSKIILASTPWGRGDKFFATCWRAGMAGEEGYASFHWPSTASPLVDQTWLDIQRKTMSERAFRAEILAEWTETEGQYFSPAELDAAVEADVPMVTAFDGPVNVGTDYGLAADANAVSILAATERTQDGAVYRVLYVEEQFRVPYSCFVGHVADLGANGFRFTRVFSECNGVGAAPTELLQTALYQRDARGYVVGVHTTAATKENAFGGLKTLAQQGRLQLPRHPSLLRQLANLEFAITESGNTRICVPEHQGHDDLAMSLCLAGHDLPVQISRRRRGSRTHFDLGQLQRRSHDPLTVGPSSR